MSDLQKLNSIIDTLEDQAKQVSEFTGLLSKINEVRNQIESSKELLKETYYLHKQFSIDTKKEIENLTPCLVNIENKLDTYGSMQTSISEKITSLDILSPQEFIEELEKKNKIIFQHLSQLEQKIEATALLQQQRQKTTNIILLLASIMILGVTVFFGIK